MYIFVTDFCFLSIRFSLSAERKANDSSRGSQRFCFSSCHFCENHQFGMMAAKRTFPYLQTMQANFHLSFHHKVNHNSRCSQWTDG